MHPLCPEVEAQQQGSPPERFCLNTNVSQGALGNWTVRHDYPLSRAYRLFPTLSELSQLLVLMVRDAVSLGHPYLIFLLIIEIISKEILRENS